MCVSTSLAQAGMLALKRICSGYPFKIYKKPIIERIKMINVGVIGCGHWGPNHIRIFLQLNNSRTIIAADPDSKRTDLIKSTFPEVKVTGNYKEVLSDPDVHAVCVASPTKTHYTIAKEALEAGKHVLCEKPLTLSPEECDNLKKTAEKAGKVLMVGHIFIFNPGITWLKNYLESGELGKVYYAYATRTNLGPFRYDVNAWWDLAAHDISIFNYLLESSPLQITARGHNCLGNSLADITFATLDYPDNRMVNIHVSWADPRKVRQITIVGEKKMVVWDELDNLGPIKLFDKHVIKTSTFYQSYGEFQLLSREGSITIPKIPFAEPLKAQAQYFIDCIQNGRSPDLVDATKGRDVVNTLCAGQRSMDNDGTLVKI
jgi:predicted dehydrogenase